MDCQETVNRYFGKNSHMSVSLTEDAAGVTVILSGSLDLDSSSALQEMLIHIIGSMAGHKRLLVDLNDVSYIPSSGVGALTIALTTARKRDIKLQLSRIQPKVRSVFELFGFMSFFEEVHFDV
jgi:anti-sigma B factor antagonist